MNKNSPLFRIFRTELAEGNVRRVGTPGAEENIWPDRGPKPVGDARVEIVVSGRPQGVVHLTGGVEARLGVACRRCLKSFAVPFRCVLDLWLDPGLGGEAEEDEGVYYFDPEEAELDLLVPVRQEVALALPAYALCEPDCPGLCPQCGADLSGGACGCPRTEPDPRWEALRQLTAPE